MTQSGESWHPIWHYLNLGASYVQIKSDKFTSVHLWSAIGGNIFSNLDHDPDPLKFLLETKKFRA
jgi:hypothetical protein